MKYIWWIIAAIVIGFIFFNNSDHSYSGNSGRYDDETYEPESDPIYDITSDNWDCTQDCSGHNAGYDWAAENGITDPEECGGNSDSFIEGCEAYANESRMEYENDYQEDDDFAY